MHRLAEDPYASELKTHKFKGEFEGTWACSVAYDLRIVFEFTENSHTRVQEILLIDIGPMRKFIKRSCVRRAASVESPL